ncbi:hypothetical protein G9A89_016291 [Geosiphon pyriformis]|nr:hypothetical protein G9A89_016291 [Geosiphon pyriformis]
MPSAPLIKFEGKEKKPTWEAYQVFWANTEHNKLLPVSLWDENRKKKQRKKLTWRADQVWETNLDSKELTTWEWDERKKEKRKVKKEEPLPAIIDNTYSYTPPQ